MPPSFLNPDPRTWDKFVKQRHGHLLQLWRWGELKGAFGWDSEIAMIGGSGGIEAGALMLFRRLPLGLGSVAYVPRGPLVDWNNRDMVSAICAAMDVVAHDHRAVFLKIEPDEEDTPALRETLGRTGFRPSPQTVQPPRTVLLDITGTEADILARMNQGTRRKIRLAAQRDIAVRRGGPRDVASYVALAQQTGQRDGFGVHSPEYYRKAYELFAPDHAVLLMASFDGKDIAGLMAFMQGKSAWYLYGASSNEERERMPNHALQWEAIRWARERGCATYDLWGIPDEDEATLEARFQNRRDGLWGVYGFKRGFGGRVWRAVGAWDRVYNLLLYTLYTRIVHQKD